MRDFDAKLGCNVALTGIPIGRKDQEEVNYLNFATKLSILYEQIF